MNVPLGTEFIKNKKLSEEIVQDIVSFMDAAKTGYFCITTNGEAGVEDALLVIDKGFVVGAHYHYLKYNTEYTAGEAMKRLVNSFLAKHGVYDAYTLTSQQLELLKIFNEDILLLERVPLRAFEGMVPVSYSTGYASQEIAAALEDTNEVLKKYGIGKIRVDDYSEIKAEVEALPIGVPDTTDRVATEIEEYLKGAPPKPTTEPSSKPEEPAKPLKIIDSTKEILLEPEAMEETIQPKISKELEELDAQAEKLRKLLLKGKR